MTPQTLADVAAALESLSSLPARTRADLRSAIIIFCRVTGLDPATTPAGDLASLQTQIASARPERGGLSPTRWSVIRSQVVRALALTGAAVPLRTAAVRLLPAWEELLAAVPMTRQRLALSRFARYCSGMGIEPATVTEETFARYREALTSGSLVRNAATVYRDAARAWSQLPNDIAGVRPSPVAVPPLPPPTRRGRHPLSAFPEAFRQDLDTLRHWCITADPLDDRARAKPLRSQTVISYASNIHTAADAAVRAGIPIADITSLAGLTRPPVYTAVLRQLLADKEQKASPTVHGVATVLLILARDWLKQSADELAQLKRIKGKLPKLRSGLTPKNRALLAAFDDQALLGRFLTLADQLWAAAQSDRLPPNQRLIKAQMAVLIGILQIVPLRRRNMCALVFDRHITWPNGPNAPALIQISAPEMKTEIDYVGELPLDVSRRLYHYRTKLAPALTGTVPTAVFVRIDGHPKRQESVADRLVVALRKHLGIHMTMHQFRHLCGKLMLDANPGAYEAVAQNLGHTGTKNVVRFYGGADTRRASRHHAALIERLREEAKQRAPGRRKGRKTP